MKNKHEDRVTEVTIVPTSHVSEESSVVVKKAVNQLQPEAVAVELDKKRLKSLKKRAGSVGESKKGIRKMIKQTKGIGIPGRLVLIFIEKLQSKISSRLDLNITGVDMFSAYEVAKKNGMRIALVDKDITKVFSTLSSKISFFRSIKYLSYFTLSYLYVSILSNKDVKEIAESADSEDTSKEAIDALEKIFPELKEVLIDERNEVIAENTYKTARAIGDTVLVIGAAHKPGVEKLLREKGEIKISTVDYDTYLDTTDQNSSLES